MVSIGEQRIAEMNEPRKILSGSTRSPAAGASLIGKTDGSAIIQVTVVLTRKQEIQKDDLQRHAMLRPQERPATDHAAFLERYGASDEAVAAVKSLAERYELNVTNVDQKRRVVELTGPATNMEQAFGTELHDYAVGKKTYRGRRGPLLLPIATTPYVEAVLGLDNRPVAKPRLRARNVQAAYYPQDLAALYRFPKGDGAGQTVALIELGGSYGPEDLQTYFAAAGLTQTPTVRSISVVPGAPVPYGQDTESDGEVMLDIEVVGSIAPAATIVVYFADNSDQGFYQAVSQAVHDPLTTTVSISWGSPEKDWSQQTMDAWKSLGQGATLLNVPIFVASGDHGCADEQSSDQGHDGQRHADFPGTCADGVISCGGTSLRSANDAITDEVVWNDGDGWATGGGVSTYFQIPAWQDGIATDDGTRLLMRGVPDVAGNADPNTGINVRVNGSNGVSGGTSAVAPQWAALTAIISQRLGRKAGFFLPLLYANSTAAPTNDIVSGNNTVFGVAGYVAKAGWDACTGLGSPDGEKLLSLLAGAAVPVAPAPQPAPSGIIAPPPQGGPAISQPRAGSQFDPNVAALYGQFVQSAYTMYETEPNNLTPAQSANFPAGYRLTAWIQMQDFLIGSTGPTFYGFVAQSLTDPSRFVVALRGTSDGVEWWDDANAALKTPFKISNCGSVGQGFARIYDTLELVERPSGAAAQNSVPQSLKSTGGFAKQITSLVKHHATTTARTAGLGSTAIVDVTGHSLGAALATLYTLENARTDQLSNSLLCTFASPFVGDSTFAAAFNALDLTSWRIVNTPDLVPKLPPQILGFTHVNTEQLFNSIGKVNSTVSCWHALSTYLSLIDPNRKPSADCQLTPPVAGLTPEVTRAIDAAKSQSISAGRVTINITVNVGQTS
jgi:kumamolisin